jgi:ATP-dependent DNA ligase
MARTRPTDYAGAAGKLELGAVAALGPRFVVQPKSDGSYARVHLDGQGRIARLFSRAAREFPRELVADLVGQRVGSPHAELVGELEVWTERANRIAATRGHRMLHLFDAIRVDGCYLGDAPYRARRDALERCRAAAGSPDPSWVPGPRGAGRDVASGRLVRQVAEGAAIAPLLEQRTAAQADAAWADWVAGGEAEGLVVVDLDAPLGKGKRKVKATETLDCRVIRAGDQLLQVEYGGRPFVISARSPGDARITAGDVVEVAIDGWYEAGATPKFARLVRRRCDLLA